MNRIWFLLSLAVAVALASCNSSKSFENSRDKTTYLGGLQSETIDNLHRLLKKDTAFINTLEADAKSTALSVSFGISGSNSGSNDSIEAVSPFTLSLSRDTAVKRISDAMLDLSLYQQYKYPNSAVGVQEPEIDETGIVSVEVKKMFSGNNEVKPENIGLKTVDRAEVLLNYRFPTGMDTLIISANAKEGVSFEGDNVAIDKIENNEAELQMPQSLYRRVLAYQAVNKNGVLMNSNSYSAFPVTVVKRTIIKELSLTKETMIQALQTDNVAKALELLSQIPETVFESKNRFLSLSKEVDVYEKKNKGKEFNFETASKFVKDLIEKYIDILLPEEQSLSLKFPDDISTLYFYIGKDYQSISENGMAYNMDNRAIYTTYQDTETNKYGIIDSLGNIIIKATLEERLSHLEGNYFVTNQFSNSELSTYSLDAVHKKLTEIKHKKFVKPIDDTKSVFQDTLGYVGVLEKNEKVVLPFAYDNIEGIGNLYVVSKSLRGRSFCQILKANGDVLEDKMADATVSFEKDGIIIRNKKGQCGLLNAEGKYLIPMQDLELGFVGKGPLLSYTNDYGVNGLMDSKGNKLTEAVYYDLGELSDGLILAEDKDYYGYLYADGRVAIPLQYTDAKPFIEGLALVTEKPGRRGMIDKQGKMVKEIPANAGDFKWMNGDSREAVYIFENATFDAKGNPINNRNLE